MKNSNILLKVEELLGRLPSNIEHGIVLLKEYLVDVDENFYQDIDDIEILVEIISILKEAHLTTKLNPFKRRGRLIGTDDWGSLKDFKKLKLSAEKDGWEVIERKFYHSFTIHKRTFFRLEVVREVDTGVHSGKIFIPRVNDEQHLHLLLDTYNLLEFKDREWKIIKDVKLEESDAEGRYFLLEELEKFTKEIASRI